MKKNKLTLLSLIAMLSVSSITLFGCNDTEYAKSVVEDFNDYKAETIEDDIGQALPIGKRLANTNNAASREYLQSDLGVILTENENDTYNIRYIAAFRGNGAISSATFTRAEYTNSKGKKVAASVSKVSYIYTSIKGSENIKWTSDTTTNSFNYFMVYTVRNIPESDIFTTLNVTLSATALDGEKKEATQEANVYGIQGDVSKGVTYEAYPTIEGTYSAIRKDADITEAVVAPYYANFEGFVATKVGKVVALNVRGGNSNYGAFESCSKLTSVTLPDTIQYFGKWAFSSCSSLTSVTFPRDLTKIESNSISSYSMNALKTVYYNAKNFAYSSNIFSFNLDTVYVSKDVESLPDKFISSSYKVSKVVYGGTTAEWNALKTESNKDNGLFIDNVLCSDSKIVTVNFHLDGGTIDGDTDTSDDLYTTEIISGHAVSNPGKVKKTGKLFKGWYSDAELTTEYDFTSILDVEEGEETKTVDLYAKLEDFPEGSDINTALDLAINGDAYSVNLSHDLQTYYFKITAPSDGKKDFYYLTGSNVKANGVSSSADYSLKVYTSTTSTIPLSTTSYTYTPDKASTGKVFGSYTGGKLTLLLEPGETVYVSATAAYTSTLEDEDDTFSFDLSLTTKDNDSEADASAYTIGETTKSKADEKLQSFETMKFTATEDKTYCVKKLLTSYFYGTVLVYHYDTDGNYVKDVELSSSTVIGDITVTSGTTYYIYCSTSNSSISDTNYMSVLIGDLPSNYKPATATSLPLDGTETTISYEGFNCRYYNVTPSKTGCYGLILSGGTTSYGKKIRVFKKDATTYSDDDVLLSATETSTSSSYDYGWGSSASYGGEVEATVSLEADATYVIEVSYNTTSTSSINDTFTFKAVERDEGDLKTIAYELTTNEDGTFADYTFNGKTAGKWFKYVANSKGYLNVYVDGLSNDNTAKFKVYSGTSTTVSASQDNAVTFLATDTGTATYYIYVETTADQTGLTLKSFGNDTTTLGNLSGLTTDGETTSRTVSLVSGCNNITYKFTSPSTAGLYTKFNLTPSAGTISFDWTIVEPTVTYTTDSGKVSESSDGTFGTKKLETNKEYCLILKNIVLSDSTATLTITPSVSEIPPDGSSAALALSLDENGTYTFNTKETADYWLKYECTESGTYKFYSVSESTSTADPKIYSVYDGLDNANSSTSSLISSGGLDDDNKYDEHKVSTNKYDYYVEVSLEAGHTYYFKVKSHIKEEGKNIVIHVEKATDSAE